MRNKAFLFLLLVLFFHDFVFSQKERTKDSLYFARVSMNTCGIPYTTAMELIDMINNYGKSVSDSTTTHCLINICIHQTRQEEKKSEAMVYYQKIMMLIDIYKPMFDYLKPLVNNFILPEISRKKE